MANNTYGTLGSEMKAMKDGRKSLMAGMRQNRQRIRGEADKLVREFGEANSRLASQTRQTLAKGNKDLRVQARQTMADINDQLAAIRTDVTALKADAGRITTEARGFLAQTGSDNAKLRAQTHKRLASDKAQFLAEAGKAMVETKAVVAGLKGQTGQMLAEAADVMKGLCAVSRQRAAAWQDIIRSMQDGRSPASASAALRRAAPAGPAKVTAHKPRQSATRSRKRKAS